MPGSRKIKSLDTEQKFAPILTKPLNNILKLSCFYHTKYKIGVMVGQLFFWEIER